MSEDNGATWLRFHRNPCHGVRFEDIEFWFYALVKDGEVIDVIGMAQDHPPSNGQFWHDYKPAREEYLTLAENKFGSLKEMVGLKPHDWADDLELE